MECFFSFQQTALSTKHLLLTYFFWKVLCWGFVLMFFYWKETSLFVDCRWCWTRPSTANSLYLIEQLPMKFLGYDNLTHLVWQFYIQFYSYSYRYASKFTERLGTLLLNVSLEVYLCQTTALVKCSTHCNTFFW